MRTALTIIALLSFGSAGFAQQNIDPNQQPAWYTTGEKWGSWVRFTQYPFLSVRGACGDDTKLNGVPMFTLYTQIRNNSAYPMAVISAEEMYDQKTGKNIVSGSFLEYLDPGQITEGISAIGGSCGATRIFYSKIRCAAKKGDEGATCFKDSQGNPIAERTDQFRERPPQIAAGTSSSTKAVNAARTILLSTIWRCKYTEPAYPQGNDPAEDSDLLIRFDPDGQYAIAGVSVDAPAFGDPSPSWTLSGNSIAFGSSNGDAWKGSVSGNSLQGTVITGAYGRRVDIPFTCAAYK